MPRKSIVEGLVRQAAGRAGSGLLVEPGHNLQDEGSDQRPSDHGLHAGQGEVCFACTKPIREGVDMRITPRGSRHDCCP
jgi:hypothetical protein